MLRTRSHKPEENANKIVYIKSISMVRYFIFIR